MRATDFHLGDEIVVSIKKSDGFTIHALCGIVDVYETSALSHWSNRRGLHVFAKVVGVDHVKGRGLLRHLVTVSLDRSTFFVSSTRTQLTDLPLAAFEWLKWVPF